MSEKNINKGIVNFVDEEHGDSIIKVVGVAAVAAMPLTTCSKKEYTKCRSFCATPTSKPWTIRQCLCICNWVKKD